MNDFDLLGWLASSQFDLPLILTFVFAAIAGISISWALWIRRTMAREAELVQMIRERTLELEEANRRLEALSYQDALTGASNRRAFDLAVNTEWRRATRSKLPLSLLMIDIDHFKTYNDTYGHPAGDRALAAVAGALGGVIRRAGDTLARYGGEEFAALLPATDHAGATAIAERMRTAVEALRIPHSGAAGGYATASIGYATVQARDAVSSDVLIDAADAALYQSKRGGRNRITAAAVAMAAPAPIHGS